AEDVEDNVAQRDAENDTDGTRRRPNPDHRLTEFEANDASRRQKEYHDCHTVPDETWHRVLQEVRDKAFPEQVVQQRYDEVGAGEPQADVDTVPHGLLE